MRLKRRIVGRTSESNCSVSSAFEIRRELDFRDRNLSWNRDHPLNSFSLSLSSKEIRLSFYYSHELSTIEGN